MAQSFGSKVWKWVLLIVGGIIAFITFGSLKESEGEEDGAATQAATNAHKEVQAERDRTTRESAADLYKDLTK